MNLAVETHSKVKLCADNEKGLAVGDVTKQLDVQASCWIQNDNVITSL